MKTLSCILFLSALFLSCQPKQDKKNVDYALVIHGGAGNITKERVNDSLEKIYQQKLNEALIIGDSILKTGGTAVDAVIGTVEFLENCPLFNAGKGAVFTNEGTNELDASIMDGRDLNAGAVAGVKTIKNPIKAAKEVMINSPHVMLSGKGAEEFANIHKLEIVEPEYFYTEKSWKSLQKQLSNEKHGTVGCVALDKKGNLAAGTSTGGMTNKRWGRIGDSPVIGAGTYANNKTCAVSATGHGEFFIRYTVAHDISALMEYKTLSLEKASKEVIQNKLIKAKGNGGIIAVDKKGNISMEFNTNGMFRGYIKSNGERDVKIFK